MRSIRCQNKCPEALTIKICSDVAKACGIIIKREITVDYELPNLFHTRKDSEQVFVLAVESTCD